MTALNLLTPKLFNISNLYNLALFICHLFNDGQFQIGHILYDPKVFDGSLVTKIDSICLIPWLKFDITQNSSLTWHQGERTDHILQLIHFDPRFLPEQIDEFKENFTFYRIFLFPTTDEISMKQRISVIGKSNPILSSNPLILHYDSKNDLIYVHLTSEFSAKSEILEERENINPSDQLVRDSPSPVHENKNLFDRTFRDFDRKQPIVIKVPVARRTKDGQTIIVYVFDQHYFANYFLSTLHITYVNMTFVPIDNPTASSTNQLLVPKQRKYHIKDLSLEYEPVNDRTS